MARRGVVTASVGILCGRRRSAERDRVVGARRAGARHAAAVAFVEARASLGTGRACVHPTGKSPTQEPSKGRNSQLPPGVTVTATLKPSAVAGVKKSKLFQLTHRTTAHIVNTSAHALHPQSLLRTCRSRTARASRRCPRGPCSSPRRTRPSGSSPRRHSPCAPRCARRSPTRRPARRTRSRLRSRGSHPWRTRRTRSPSGRTPGRLGSRSCSSR